jgi:general secretion pathway protein A
MDYFRILSLSKEPFSNSPDPEYFFQSRQHIECLQKLELSLRLRRGLSVVIGEVGTGKTTLCRQLIRRFIDEQEVDTHLILDPNFSSPSEFLGTIAEMFVGKKPEADANEWQVKEIIKQYLFQKGVDENKIVVLIIDEGQKIPDFCLEILRELLNYETNEFKLLQIAIFAQTEFEKTLNHLANFSDRVNFKHYLKPMNFRDTRSMIQFRLEQASETAEGANFFTWPAFWAIYQETRGFPRKIINLCHRCILAMIIQNRSRIGWSMVKACIKNYHPKTAKRDWQFVTVIFLGFILVMLLAGISPDALQLPGLKKSEVLESGHFSNKKVSRKIINNPMPETGLVVEKERFEAVNQTRDTFSSGTDEPERIPSDIEIDDQRMEMIPPEPSPEFTAAPEMLGRVTMGRNETLWRLVEKVYGMYTREKFETLRRANPRIVNPNHVEFGQRITVPAIPASVNALPESRYWVEIAEEDNLNSAIARLRSYPEEAPRIRLISHWNKSEGLKFSVVLQRCFSDEALAKARLNGMPSHLVSKGNIISSWKKDTVFFVNPLLGK